jgi:hypothetical protein
MQYLDTVKPMHDRFVEPSKQYASILPYFVFILYDIMHILYYIMLFTVVASREKAQAREGGRRERRMRCSKCVCVCMCVCVCVCVCACVYEV